MSIRRLDPRLLAPPPGWARIVATRVIIVIILLALSLVLLSAGIAWPVVSALMVLVGREARRLVAIPGLS